MANLTDAQKNLVRKYCGFAARGTQPNPYWGQQFWLQPYATVELRLQDGQLSDDEVSTVSDMLTNLQAIEQSIYDARENLDTSVAAVWTHNATEVHDKIQLYQWGRQQLVYYIMGPYAAGPGVYDGQCTVVV